MVIMASAIKNRLQEVLEARNMTISDLQRKTGLSYPSVHHLVTSTPKSIRLDTLARLCDALDVEVGDLLERVQQEP